MSDIRIQKTGEPDIVEASDGRLMGSPLAGDAGIGGSKVLEGDRRAGRN